LSCLAYKTNYTDNSEYYANVGFNVKPVKRDGKMSVMFDPDTAIYPFPPKPTPLSIDEKAYYREKIKRLLKVLISSF
ncbi:putative quinolinate synthetase A, partial [Staphylococcus epidermidis W23144]|uniref:hypothetical protein n=1 Tax=Staphylococcus epidermidis TaxID=1282 RepID=UPI0001A96113